MILTKILMPRWLIFFHGSRMSCFISEPVQSRVVSHDRNSWQKFFNGNAELSKYVMNSHPDSKLSEHNSRHSNRVSTPGKDSIRFSPWLSQAVLLFWQEEWIRTDDVAAGKRNIQKIRLSIASNKLETSLQKYVLDVLFIHDDKIVHFLV